MKSSFGWRNDGKSFSFVQPVTTEQDNVADAAVVAVVVVVVVAVVATGHRRLGST